MCFHVNIAKFYRAPLVAVSVLYTMLAQADQDNIMWLFSYKNIYVRSGPILHE